MTGFTTWCAELEALVEAGNQGEPLRLDAVAKLAEHARALGPQLDPDQRKHVTTCIAKISDIIRDGMDHLEHQMAELSERRVGIRGYGQLRSSHIGQRLRRRI